MTGHHDGQFGDFVGKFFAAGLEDRADLEQRQALAQTGVTLERIQHGREQAAAQDALFGRDGIRQRGHICAG